MHNEEQNERFCRQVLLLEKSMILLALSILKNEYDAQDALQNTLIKAYENFTCLRAQEKFKPWIFQILVNECSNLLRKRTDYLSFEETEQTAGIYERDIAQTMDIWQSVQSLKAEYRTMIILYYYEGLSLKQIAEILNISPDNAKKRLQRSRDALKNALKGDGYL